MLVECDQSAMGAEIYMLELHHGNLLITCFSAYHCMHGVISSKHIDFGLV